MKNNNSRKRHNDINVKDGRNLEKWKSKQKDEYNKYFIRKTTTENETGNK